MSAITIDKLTKSFLNGKVTALSGVTASFEKTAINGIVGPDGAGKTTLLRHLAALMRPVSGTCTVLGYDIDKEAEKVHRIIGYLPQKFGLYEELTVAQNLRLYEQLQSATTEDVLLKKLLDFSGLRDFQSRPAGKLSGGMKQKLGLICALLRRPQVLLLDEPTVGVDPVSQIELWKMILNLKEEGVTLVISTSYLEEAEKCDRVVLLNEGKVLFSGPPKELTETMRGRTFHIVGAGMKKRNLLESLVGKEGIIDATIEGDSVRVVTAKATILPPESHLPLGTGAECVSVEPRFEDAFVDLLGGNKVRPSLPYKKKNQMLDASTSIVEAQTLTKKFGTFTAVDNISFSLKRGEIFGLLGPNGAGKSTTFKMLCGLLTPTEGKALVAGMSLEEAPRQTRSSIGYMAQKFSLYEDISVMQNLSFFSGVYPVEERAKTIEQMIQVFDLKTYLSTLAKDLSLGFKQRLALSCALMHQPQVLFLDEPTSGVDPLTRREFWHQINHLSECGVTVLVTTHLMEEAEFCDRIAFIFQGKLQIVDTPEVIKKTAATAENPHPTLRDAFLAICSE